MIWFTCAESIHLYEEGGVSACTLNVRFQGCLILYQPYGQTGARVWMGVSGDLLLRVCVHQVTLQKHANYPKTLHLFIWIQLRKWTLQTFSRAYSQKTPFAPEARLFGLVKLFYLSIQGRCKNKDDFIWGGGGIVGWKSNKNCMHVLLVVFWWSTFCVSHCPFRGR